MTTVMQAVRDWLKTYPELNGRLDVDFLDNEAETYSIDTIPCETILKRYHDGSSRRQFQFAVSSRRFYDQNIPQNLANLDFFENLADWIEGKARARQLPELGESRTAQKIVITSSAYPFLVTEDGKARYQMQMRIEYYQQFRR